MGNSVAYGQIWAPPDSLFKAGENMVRFNPDIIDAEYFCDHPWQPVDDQLRMKRLTDPNIDPSTGYSIPNADLINHTAVLNLLTSLNVQLEPMWAAEKDPCLSQNRIKITRWGDTLVFPYWCSFIAHFPDTISPVAFGYYLTITDYNAVQHSYPLIADTVYSERGAAYDPYYTV